MPSLAIHSASQFYHKTQSTILVGFALQLAPAIWSWWKLPVYALLGTIFLRHAAWAFQSYEFAHIEFEFFYNRNSWSKWGKRGARSGGTAFTFRHAMINSSSFEMSQFRQKNRYILLLPFFTIITHIFLWPTSWNWLSKICLKSWTIKITHFIDWCCKISHFYRVSYTVH